VLGLAGLTLAVLVQIGAVDRAARQVHVWLNVDGRHHVPAQALSGPVR